MSLASFLGIVEASRAQENGVTAIDILLEPDTTMVRHAQADNTRLLNAYPKGFALNATHQPHLTLIQQFVRTADLDKVYAAANRVLAKEKAGRLEPEGVQVLLHSRSTERHCRHCRRAHRRFAPPPTGLLDAVAPFTEKTGTAAAFVSAAEGRDIQQGLIDYVANFAQSQPARSSIRTSQLVSLPKPISRRCSRNHLRHSSSRLWARRFINSAVLAQPARSSGPCR